MEFQFLHRACVNTVASAVEANHQPIRAAPTSTPILFVVRVALRNNSRRQFSISINLFSSWTNSHHNTRRALIHSSRRLPDPPLRRRLPASHTRRRVVAISPHLSPVYTTNRMQLTRRPSSIQRTSVLSANPRVASPTVIEFNALSRRLIAKGLYYPSSFEIILLYLI